MLMLDKKINNNAWFYLFFIIMLRIIIFLIRLSNWLCLFVRLIALIELTHELEDKHSRTSLNVPRAINRITSNKVNTRTAGCNCFSVADTLLVSCGIEDRSGVVQCVILKYIHYSTSLSCETRYSLDLSRKYAFDIKYAFSQHIDIHVKVHDSDGNKFLTVLIGLLRILILVKQF